MDSLHRRGTLSQMSEKGGNKSPPPRTALTTLDLKHLSLDLVLGLQNLPASRKLSSNTGRGSLSGDLSRFYSGIDSEQIDASRILGLLRVVVDSKPDEIIFQEAYTAVAESTPPPRPQAHTLQTPYAHSTSSIVNSSEHRQHMDDILKEELGSIYIGLLEFHAAFFGKIKGLEETAEGHISKMSGRRKSIVSPGSGLARLA